MNKKLVATLAVLTLVAIPAAAAMASYTWTQVGEENQLWQRIAMSDNGLVVYSSRFDNTPPYEGRIWKSIDGGSTWVEQMASPAKKIWQAIATSADGAKVIGIGYGHNSYSELLSRSTNGGASWVNVGTSSEWLGVAMSSSGSVVAAVSKTIDATNGVWRSTDGGDNWSDVTPRAGASKIEADWRSVAVSSNGDVMVAGGDNMALYVSTNSGATWTAKTPVNSGAWTSIKMSGSGQVMVATLYDGDADDNGVWISADSGVTWARTLESEGMVASSVSRDGSTIAVARYRGEVLSGAIYVSRDAGATWEAEPAPDDAWTGIGLSASGERMVVAAELGFMQVATSTTTTTTTTTVALSPETSSTTSTSTTSSSSTSTTTSSSTTTSAAPTTTSSTVVDSPPPVVSASMVESFATKPLVKDSASIAPGDTVTVRISGFQPYELVSIGVESTGAVQSQAASGRRVLVTVRADETGTIEVRTKLPMSLSGEATLWAYGRESKRGFRQTLSVGILPGTGARRVADGIVEGTLLVLAGAAVFSLRRRLCPQ
jgi:hypothetical protein